MCDVMSFMECYIVSELIGDCRESIEAADEKIISATSKSGTTYITDLPT